MNNTMLKAEAAKLLAAFDAGEFEMYCEERTARHLADYFIELQFARVDIDCDWNDVKCQRMFKRMQAALVELGLPKGP